MSYLIFNIVLALASTFLVGLLFGWLIWGRLKNRFAVLETNWRNRYLSLDSKYQSVVTRFSELELELNNKTSRISKLNDDKKQMFGKLHTAKSVKHETDKELEQLKDQLGQITARYHIVSKTLDERNEELKILRQSPNEVNELKSLLGQATQRYNNNNLALNNKCEELAALQNAFDETNKHTVLLGNELDHLREQHASIANLQQALKIERERIPALESQLEAAQAELLDAKKHVSDLKGSLKQRDSSITALEGEITRIVDELTPARDKLNQRDKQVHELKQDIHALQQKIPAFKSTIAARDAHIRELETLINDAQKALLKPANLAIATNGNGEGKGNGSKASTSGTNTNGSNNNVIRLNGNAATNGNGAHKNGSCKTNGTGNSVAKSNGQAKANGSASSPRAKNRTGNTTQKRKIKPYGLKKPNRKPDDLKLITGIGETLEKTLHECGIFYFEQIAGFSHKDVEAVDDLLNFKRRVDRDDWINQARKLMNDKSSSASKTVSASKKASQKNTSKRTPRKRAVKTLGMKRPAGKLDDLQLINGIGPTLEKKLHRLGIYHYEQIAQLTAEDIKLIDYKLKTYKGRVKRDKWPMQARRLHKEFHISP